MALPPSTWRLVPNPAANHTQLRGLPLTARMRVLNLAEQVLRKFLVGTVTLELRGLLPGVYVLQAAGCRPQWLVVQP